MERIQKKKTNPPKDELDELQYEVTVDYEVLKNTEKLLGEIALVLDD